MIGDKSPDKRPQRTRCTEAGPQVSERTRNPVQEYEF